MKNKISFSFFEIKQKIFKINSPHSFLFTLKCETKSISHILLSSCLNVKSRCFSTLFPNRPLLLHSILVRKTTFLLFSFLSNFGILQTFLPSLSNKHFEKFLLDPYKSLVVAWKRHTQVSCLLEDTQVSCLLEDTQVLFPSSDVKPIEKVCEYKEAVVFILCMAWVVVVEVVIPPSFILS